MAATTEATYLIADAGATKTDWCLISKESGELLRFATSGINAAIMSDDEIERRLHEAVVEIEKYPQPVKVIFYGAGCSTEIICNRMKELLYSAFGCEDAEIGSDLLAAARSLFGNKPGVVCILGTGSNSCRYDGHKITRHTPSLGYVLGDEGSGADIGMTLLSDAFKGLMPAALSKKFKKEYGLKLENVIENVYRKPAANAYVASFAKFAADNIHDYYIRDIVKERFELFIERNLLQYKISPSTFVNFTGSIAYYFSDILVDTCINYLITVHKISKTPLDDLINYHLEAIKDK